MALDGSIKTVINLTDTLAQGGEEGDFRVRKQHTISLANGTGANQADILYVADDQFSAASQNDKDLAGSLTDALGNTITMAEVVGFAVINQRSDGTVSSSHVDIGNATNAWHEWLGAAGTTVRVPAGGFFMLISPDADGLGAVTAGTDDTLRITTDVSGTYYCQTVVLGRSA